MEKAEVPELREEMGDLGSVRSRVEQNIEED